jgi:hypothetical protein
VIRAEMNRQFLKILRKIHKEKKGWILLVLKKLTFPEHGKSHES